MSVITSLTATKKSQDYINIYIDERFAFCLNINTVAEIGLYKGLEISSSQIKNLVVKDFYNKLLNLMISNISKSRKTENEVKRIIRKKIDIKIFNYKKDLEVDFNEIFSEEVINNLIDDIILKLKDYNLINDELYANDFIHSRLSNRPRSKSLISYELSKKGITKDLINKIIAEIDIDEVEIARNLLLKKYKSDVIIYTEQSKVRYLASKGYNWDIIEIFIKRE